MGFGNHGTPYKFAKVACGKIHIKVGDEKKEYDFFDGTLTAIELATDTYEEQPKDVVQIILTNGDAEKVRLQFTFETWFSVGFFARIGKIDLAKPFRLGVMQSEKNGKISFCYMKQDGKKIESDKSAPRPEKKTVGKKQVDDWTLFDSYAEKIIDNLNTKLNSDGATIAKDDAVPPPEEEYAL